MPYVNVEVDLDDIHIDDLVEELKRRNYDWEEDKETMNPNLELITEIYELRRLNKDYQSKLDQLIFDVLGKIV